MTLRAAGVSDVGCLRTVNEDRFLVDADRGIFVVIDGVGGQAAGGRAADTARDVIEKTLTQANGAVSTRIREAITQANNEVHRQAATRPEWHGMACVLTAAVVEGDRAVIGHVGDTRLYKIRNGTIQKITADHSPVGEREDAGELSERDAMRHPRRNEVYRDVGSGPHDVGDADFVDVKATSMEPDAALLLCSDGLTDLVSSGTIHSVIRKHAGSPDKVAQALVEAANDAGGKDNVTVVYVEGERFRAVAPVRRSRILAPLTIALLVLAGLAWWWRSAGYPIPEAIVDLLTANRVGARSILVRPGESIAAALEKAAPGSTILVASGDYRERVVLRPGVRLVSLVSRGATLRLPGNATDADAAVVATDVPHAELSGFRIVGDSASALGTAVLVRSSSVRLVDLEITGAARVAIDLGAGDDLHLLASDIHDNPGAALAVRAKASARIAHNTWSGAGITIESGSRTVFTSNVFRKIDPRAFPWLDATNLFPDARPARQ
jgi:serine/threonine protein phosphatase PrpC